MRQVTLKHGPLTIHAVVAAERIRNGKRELLIAPPHGGNGRRCWVAAGKGNLVTVVEVIEGKE